MLHKSYLSRAWLLPTLEFVLLGDSSRTHKVLYAVAAAFFRSVNLIASYAVFASFLFVQTCALVLRFKQIFIVILAITANFGKFCSSLLKNYEIFQF